MEHYVYALIDPNDNRPFYIGKGKGDRCYHHLRESYNRSDNKRKWRRIERIRNSGNEPIVEKVSGDMDEVSALEMECKLIAQYGRIGFEPNGILTNLTLGGDGMSGYRHTEETKAILRQKRKMQPTRPCSEETKRKIGEKSKGRIHVITDERRENSRMAAKKAWEDRNRDGAKNSLAAITHRKKSPEEIEKIRSKLKGRVVPPEERAKMLANKSPMTEEIKAKISANKKGKPWSDARRAAQARTKGTS